MGKRVETTMSTSGLHFTVRLPVTHHFGEKGGHCGLASLEKDPQTVGSRGLEGWRRIWVGGTAFPSTRRVSTETHGGV